MMDPLGKHFITLNHKEALCEFIKAQPKRVLFVLDGLDEVSEQHPVVKAFLSSQSCVLITSRPKSFPFEPNRQVDIIGFSAQNRERYIHRYFELTGEPKAEAHNLLSWLQGNPQKARIESKQNKHLMIISIMLDLPSYGALWRVD